MGCVKLFTYGLLMKGMRYHESHIAGLYDSVVPASASGRLMFLPEPEFPALAAGEGVVKGEVYDLDENSLPRLDFLFGVKPGRPDQSEYVRRKLDVVTAGGETVPAEAYFIRAEILRTKHPKAVWIEDGDWSAFFEEREAQRREEARRKNPMI